MLTQWYVGDLTVKANMAASEEDKLPEDELIGQMSCVPFSLSSFHAEDSSSDIAV